MTIDKLQQEMRDCTKCAGLFAERWVDPGSKHRPLEVRPIFAGAANAPVMLVGQSPGISEYESGQAFQGQAGGDIRKIFQEIGVPSHQFDEVVYQTSVTKCFPGRKYRSDTGREEDNQPMVQEITNCMPFLRRQMDIVNPRILLVLGRCAIDAYLRLRNDRYSRYGGGLNAFVGRSEQWDRKVVVFFPHTSGASRWLNPPHNRELFANAKSLLARALRENRIVA